MDENSSVMTTQNQEEPKQKDKSFLLILLGLLIVTIFAAGLIIFLPGNSATDQTIGTPSNSSSTKINTRADLEKASSQLDQANLDNLSNDLNLNDIDAASF